MRRGKNGNEKHPNQLPAKNSDTEVFRFVLVVCGEEVRWENSFVWDRRVRQAHAVLPATNKLGRDRRCLGSIGKVSSFRHTTNRWLTYERFPVGRHPVRGSGNGLIFRMGMRWKQFHALDHCLRFVIVEPILTRLKAGDNRMPGLCRMLGSMLAWRTIAATDVPTLRTPTEVKPPTVL
jgi:hypothetical protein